MKPMASEHALGGQCGKRIVFTTFGSLGDLHPQIALGLELQARGHQVLIATHSVYREMVETEGIGFRSIRPDVEDVGSEAAVMKKIMNQRSGPEFLIRQIVMPHLRESYEDLTAACAGADLLVTNPLTLAGPLVVEKGRQRGLAWASIGIAPLAFTSAFDPPVFAPAPWLIHLKVLGPRFYGALLQAVKGSTWTWLAPWRRLRAEIGLPPNRANPMFDGQFSPHLVLALFSPLLASPQPDWPPNTVMTGFPFYDRSGADKKPDAALETFLNAGEPPIVFTLGSAAVMDAEDFYLQSIGVAQKLGKRALLLIGRDARNRPTKLPEGIAVFEYAPYSRVFPRAVAIVHQGGIGTTAQSLRAGVPMLVVPFGFDQPDNAARVTRLGVARTISRKQYAARAEKELRVLLTDPAYRQKAAEVGHLIRNEDGARSACDALELLLKAR